MGDVFNNLFINIPQMKIKRCKRNNGPDIEINYDNKIYYIECIAPTQGVKYDITGEIKGNYLPSIKINAVAPLPINELKIRLSYALEEKAKKYKKYIDKSKVNIKDNLVIAINTSCLSQYGELMDFNEPLIKTVCEEINFFEKYPFIDYIIYSHKSIFDYNQISIKILKKDLTVI